MMATVTRPEPQPVLDDGEELTYENAYEVIDGIPIGRPVHDPAAKAYEEAYEVVDGQILEWPMGALPEYLASRFHVFFGAFVATQKLGWATCEVKFRLPSGSVRRPDIAFCSYTRWPKSRRLDPVKDWAVTPDLAVEVVSKTDEAWDVIAKVREYFDAGVRAVWLVYPNVEVVHVHHAWDRIEVVTRAGTLDGGEVVPGFRLPLAELFEEEAEPEAAEATGPTPEAGPAA